MRKYIIYKIHECFTLTDKNVKQIQWYLFLSNNKSQKYIFNAWNASCI